MPRVSSRSSHCGSVGPRPEVRQTHRRRRSQGPPSAGRSVQPVAFEVSEGEALDQHIVWRVEAEHEAFFIPQKLWDTTPLDKLPISNGDMEMLHYRLSDGAIEPSPLLGLLLRRVPWLDRRVWLAEQRAKGVEPRACEQPRIEKPETRKLLMEAPRPLLELIENNVISFLGEIVAVVPGADPTGFPQEAVYIRVDEVLSDRQQQVRPGSILVRLRSRGSVRRSAKR